MTAVDYDRLTILLDAVLVRSGGTDCRARVTALFLTRHQAEVLRVAVERCAPPSRRRVS